MRSKQGLVKGEELFSFCDLTSSLISFTNKELTNSLLLASDCLTISVCVIWFDKRDSEKKSQYDQFLSFTNP